MRLTIEISGVTKGDIALFEKMNSSALSISVRSCENFAQITAFGRYDELIPVIMQTTSYKSYTIKLR